MLGKGKPLYMIRRAIEDDGDVFDDGSHIVYVNTSMVDEETPLGKFSQNEREHLKRLRKESFGLRHISFPRRNGGSSA